MKNAYCVTGVAGFIGSTLAERLTSEGYWVIGIDCFTDYYSREQKERNLSVLSGRDNFRLLEADLASLDDWEILEEADGVFHQAAQAGVRASWGSEFSSYTRHNILATQRLLEASKGKNVRIVYASSSSVYGDTNLLPMREADPISPVSPYGVTKLAAEHMCRLYTKNFGLPTVSLRYFTVYGPRQRPDMGFHKFIKALLNGHPITLYGNGEQTRDFTYIDDIVEANIRAMQRGRAGEVYNIGGGSRVTVNHVLDVLQEVAGVPAQIEHTGPQHGDAPHTWADLTAAERDLDYKPAVTLETGLAAQLDWQKTLTGSITT